MELGARSLIVITIIVYLTKSLLIFDIDLVNALISFLKLVFVANKLERTVCLKMLINCRTLPERQRDKF